MTAFISPPPRLQFFTNAGVPMAGGFVYTYAAGTTTPLVTYTDSTGLVANTNPVILDSRGEASIWLGGVGYKFKLATPANVDVWTQDNIAPGSSAYMTYTPAGTGAVTTTVQAKLRESVSVKDFGAVGDGVTDDTAAIQACINAIKSNVNASGDYGGEILFPTGVYVLTSPISLATTSDVFLTLSFVGSGGYPGRGATQLVWKPAASSNGLVLKSSQNCKFTNIEFISGNNNVDKLIYITSQDSPVFSAFMNSFVTCSFRQYSGTTPITRLITIAGGVLTEFDKCWFSGSDNVIRLGEDLPLTASGGGAGQTVFNQCEIYHDVEILNSLSLIFYSCVFGRKNLTTPVSIYPSAAGFFRQDFTSIIGCTEILAVSSSTVTFFTQGVGTGQYGVFAANNRFTSYQTIFNINGNGQVLLQGNHYAPPPLTVGCIAVILGANAKNAALLGENYDLFLSGGFVGVLDSRISPAKPLVVNASLAVAQAFAAVGTYEDFITASIQLRGGQYRVSWALSITAPALADFIVRLNVNGVSQPNACATQRIAAGETNQITNSSIINLAGTTAAVTVALTCRQGAGAAATVNANGITYASLLQIEEIK